MCSQHNTAQKIHSATTCSSVSEEVLNFLLTSGVSQPFELQQITSSENNLVYKVTTKNKNYLLKCYLPQQTDSRSRLLHEILFYGYAESIGLNKTPKLIASEQSSKLALFQFVESHQQIIDNVRQEDVDQLALFFLKLNHERFSPAAKNLPKAFEAFFTVNEHLQYVNNRVQQLLQIKSFKEVDRELLEMIERQLVPMWEDLKNNIHAKCVELSFNGDEPIAEPERCISPSDFGLHNCIHNTEEELVFIDFEEAGWDEPARMLSELFTQATLPIPFGYFEDFTAKTLSLFPTPRLHLIRTALLLPVYQIKSFANVANRILKHHSHSDKEAVESKEILEARRLLENLPRRQAASESLFTALKSF